MLEISGIALPTEDMPPITFVVAKEGTLLREDPRVEDTPFANDGPWEHPGNFYASIKRGAKGKAVGQRKGNNGETWWFVVLEPAASLSVDYLSWTEEKATSRSGWINGKDLTM